MTKITHFMKAIGILAFAWGTLLSAHTFAYTITWLPNTNNYGNPVLNQLLQVSESLGDVGSTVSFFYNGPGLGSVPGDNLLASGTMTFSSYTFNPFTNKSAAILNFHLSNNTAAGDAARITAFGMDLTPNATGATLSTPGTTFIGLSNGNFPAFNAVDECIFSGINCAGGANSGLTAQHSDNFAITLTYNGNPLIGGGSLVFADFAFKWQSALNGNSYEFGPCSTISSYNQYCQQTPTPEPDSVSLLLFGGIMASALYLKRRKN